MEELFSSDFSVLDLNGKSSKTPIIIRVTCPACIPYNKKVIMPHSKDTIPKNKTIFLFIETPS